MARSRWFHICIQLAAAVGCSQAGPAAAPDVHLPADAGPAAEIAADSGPADAGAEISELNADNSEFIADKPELDANNSEFDTNNSEFDTNNSEFDTNNPEFDTNNSEFDANKPELDANKPKLDADKPEYDANSPEIDADLSDSNVDVDKTALPDADPPDSGLEFAETADPATPTTATLTITLASDVTGLQGMIDVKVLPAAVFLAGKMGPGAGGEAVYGGPLPPLPATFDIELPAGAYMPMAMVFGGNGPVAAALSCSGGGPQIVQITPQMVAQGQNPQAKLQIVAVTPPIQTEKLCGNDFAPSLQPLSWTATPPTAWGGAHLLQGRSDGERYWVAGSQDGLVSFDLPQPPTQPAAPLANWTVHEGMFCNRMALGNGKAFCASRAGYLHVFDADKSKPKVTPTAIDVAAQTTEGLCVRDQTLYVAVHAQGLVAHSAAAPFAPLPLKSPPQLQDAWDVAALGPQHLLVADGKAGLKAYQFAKDGALLLAGSLPLPGVAAFLRMQQGPNGPLAVVACLGGGLQVVDAGNPAQLQVAAAWPSFGMVTAGLIADGQLVQAAGHFVLAAAWPGTPSGQFAAPSLGYALDVDQPAAGYLRSAEFTGVRQWQIAAAPKPAPLLWVAPTAGSAVYAVGETMQVQVWLGNAGALPLQVGPLVVDEAPGVAQKTTIAAGSWTLQPNQGQLVTVKAPKTVKGVTQHQIHLYSNDPAGQRAVNWQETTFPVAGQPLPLLQYKTAAGVTVDVKAQFAGKLGVLMVAAQACPVAALGMASLAADLQPYLQAGTVAAVAINPWDKPSASPELAAIQTNFPVLYSPLTTADNHNYSVVIDELLGQPGVSGPPMPLVFVVGKSGLILYSAWGYVPGTIKSVVASALGGP